MALARRLPVLGITGGDPCGIGPEVILKALAAPQGPCKASYVVIGDARVFARTARRLHLRLPWLRSGASRVSLIDLGHPDSFLPGRSSAAAGQAALDYLAQAVTLARAGQIDGLVTAPVTKWAIERRLPRFVGQTEYLAQAFARRAVAMMFVSDRLRVVLLTRHVALRQVPRMVTQALVRTTLRLTIESLRTQFHLTQPRLAVCGLNPHAGEGGLFGQEEQRMLLPVLRQLRRLGLRCDGPFAADGFFTDPSGYDAVVCWYHDQGLIPFKMIARDVGCQLTVGLPFPRTSPDHGSALDIAGRGVANAGSMMYALNLAVRLARCNR